MEANDLNGGRVLDGYRLIRFLGRGGFGEVWLCRSETMGDYRAIKMIPTTSPELLEKEYESLLHYRKAAARLRSPQLVPIEHVNRNAEGLYYVMPLADGLTAHDPSDPAWQPLSLTARIHAQAAKPAWFTSQEIAAILLPILQALQTLSDAGLVHRDVKPENILFFNGLPCLGDISLLGADASHITRRGTPGYATPSWYAGGHPDMFGIAATLYSLLTGNSPDKMGRAAFIWPPQGEASLAEAERAEWKRLHAVIRRATDEKVSERFVDFAAMADHISRPGASGHDLPARPRLPRILLSALTVVGVVAATVVAGFRSKQAETRTTTPNPPVSNQPEKVQVPELTADQKADYQALAGMIQGYIGDGNYANALASVETLLSTYPQSRTQPAYSIARAMALKGLGRIDEAKAELRKDIHLSPNITAMATRKDLWEEFGDLDSAEKDLTRILVKFGPNSFPLFLRADIRAKRGNFPGVHADRQAAYAYKPEELEQRRLVDSMWAPLETKYPGYAAYLKTVPPDPYDKGAKKSDGASESGNDDKWIVEVFDSIMSATMPPVGTISGAAMRARKTMAEMSLEGFKTGDYAKPLGLLEETFYSVPALANAPVLSLFRAVLLKRLGRTREAENELVKLIHRDSGPLHLDARICLLSALDRKREAEALLTRMIAAIPPSDHLSGTQAIPLLQLRARIRAVLGDFAGARADHLEALALVPAEGPSDKTTQQAVPGDPIVCNRQSIQAAWVGLQSQYPGYAAYLKALPEK